MARTALTAGRSILAMVLLVGISALAFRGAYGGTTARALLRTAVVGVVYLVAIGLVVAAMVAPVITRAFP